MDDNAPDDFDNLKVPFIFVKRGDPEPIEWMREHPGWVKFPAVMIARDSPWHSANGGAYPNFDGPEWVQPAAAEPPLSEAEQFPLGRPVSHGLRGRMSRLRPGVQPQYPAGHGAPPGHPGTGNPVAAYLRISATMTPAALIKLAQTHLPPAPTPEQIAKARLQAFLHLIRWSENGGVSDSVAYHARFGGKDPMTDAQMLHYKPKPELWVHKDGTREWVTAAGAYGINKNSWSDGINIWHIKDFTPSSQDKIAVHLIARASARADIEQGDLDQAIAKVLHSWASLPGGKQPRHEMEELRRQYQKFLRDSIASEMEHKG